MALIDEVVIRVFGGAGGNGCISFRREKYVPRGGPNGGHGGAGGSVYLLGTRDKTSLLDFKYQPKYQGERGEHGMGKDMDGRGGEDLVVRVPLGTLVYDQATGELLGDLVVHGAKFLVAKGGKGGKGNLAFVTSTCRAPRISTPGEAGQARELRLELRLLADVGLVGLPNAGKSSFLRVISRAQPKIANYPFTTLEPHLGVVDHKGQGFVVADLPGLIEGASEGAGLGDKFLRHVARNRILLHLVDVSSTEEEIERQVEVIRDELRAYDASLLEREELLVFTKSDLLSTEDLADKKAALHRKGLDGFFISSHSGLGVSALLDRLADRLQGGSYTVFAPVPELPEEQTA
jgi:GTP-binding protein